MEMTPCSIPWRQGTSASCDAAQSAHCDVRITEIADHGVEGITCTVVTARDSYALSIPAPGAYMAYSASIAVAVGEELGLSREEIIRGVGQYEPGRIPDAGDPAARGAG